MPGSNAVSFSRVLDVLTRTCQVHEARFALEDLGGEAPPEVKEAAEEEGERGGPRADFLGKLRSCFMRCFAGVCRLCPRQRRKLMLPRPRRAVAHRSR